MSHTLLTKAFFFNAKTDYLPYYKQFTITLDDNAIAKDILKAIQVKNENFSFPELNLVFKINDLVVDEDTKVSDIVDKLGTKLIIDPVNSYRSNNGLIINNNDFMQSFELLAPYATPENKTYYKTLYALHYASESEKFDHEYVGDALLLLAHKMITEGNTYKTEILHAITSTNSGLYDCEYENNLFYEEDYTPIIENLKAMTKNDDSAHTPSLLDMIKSKFFKNKQDIESLEKTNTITDKTIDNLEEKNIAYNAGITKERKKLISQMIIDIGAKEINTKRVHKLSGLSLLKENKNLAYKKAGATLLDAYDSGAEVLIIEDTETYNMIEMHFSEIENTIGRKIIGLEIISSNDFIAQSSTIA